jgi:hypothetical protein
MTIAFKSEDHTYISINDEKINWISVTSLINNFKKSFDAKKVAEKVSKNKKSKWYGLNPLDIQNIWACESLRATTLGTYYHNQRETDICSFASMERDGITIPVVSPLDLKDGLKIAPIQKLEPGIYPEHMVYLKSAGICGQSDLVEVVNNKVNIIDYKTNKEIKMESYVDWDGKSEKLCNPVNNLDDCNFNHYALQLSVYMYIILKHNPKLKVGKMLIHHVIFDEDEKDLNGYPVTKYNENGDPIVKEVIVIPVPYLQDEVISIMHYLKDNPIKKIK